MSDGSSGNTLFILDTNVLVRYLVRDDVQQAEVARRILESLAAERPGFVCREVTVELVWVLNRSYDLSPQKITAVLLELLATEGIVIESAGDVAHAALQYGTGESGLRRLDDPGGGPATRSASDLHVRWQGITS